MPVPPQLPTALPLFDRLWLAEAVRLREAHAGPLDDGEANRQARQAGGDLATRLEHRALWLAARDGLPEALRHFRQGARLAALALAGLALLSGAGLALGALGDGQRPVNLVWALGSLLGLQLLTLLGWLLGLVLAGDSASALGRLWLWLSERFARDARALQLAPALLGLLQRRGLGRWGLGMAVHGLWSLVMTSALLTLLAMLSARRYGFVWETTLLDDQAFIVLLRAVGALPALLGFALPDAAAIHASGVPGAAPDALRQLWAVWLVGAVLAWGLLPRLLLTGLCTWRWHRARARLRLDPDQPDYHRLRERLLPSSERLGVNDPAPTQSPPPPTGLPLDGHQGAVLVAIELDDRRAWPPALPRSVADAGVLDDRQQRNRLLEQLTRDPPARLLIACEPLRSPDRGTLALIGELSRCAGQTRVWLPPPAPGEPLDSARLADWHTALAALGLSADSGAPLHWLEHGHD